MSAQSHQELSNWLQRIGEGTEMVYPQYGANDILILPDMCVGCMPGDTIATLIERICGSINDIQNHEDHTKYIMEHAILTPLNEDVDAINNKITTNVIRQIDGSSIATWNITVQKQFWNMIEILCILLSISTNSIFLAYLHIASNSL
jgi:hypothetical protein